MNTHLSPTRSHFYEDIDGWFDYEDIYREMVEQAEDGARFVEIGAWLGRSTAFMAVEIANSAKSIEFYAVDTWRGSPSESHHQDIVQRHGGSMYPAFLKNMRTGGVAQYVTPLEMTSREATSRFDSDSLDFVFIDGCHDYPAVRDDISRWKTKVKPGKFLAGHDLERQGIRQAVQDVLPWSQVISRRSSWFWCKDALPAGHWLHRGDRMTGGDVPKHMLFIPCAACPDEMMRAVNSISQPWIEIVVIDSSAKGLDLENRDLPPHVDVFRTSMEMSFTQLQNWAQAEARRRGAKWLMFMHADCHCADKQVVPEVLLHAERLSRTTKLGVLFTAYDALCAFNMEAVEDVGAWDETFDWYWSDCDYYHRMRLREWHIEDWPEAFRVHHEPSSSIQNDEGLAERARRCSQFARDHYVHKWGGEVGHEVHAIPYNGKA